MRRDQHGTKKRKLNVTGGGGRMFFVLLQLHFVFFFLSHTFHYSPAGTSSHGIQEDSYRQKELERIHIMETGINNILAKL